MTLTSPFFWRSATLGRAAPCLKLCWLSFRHVAIHWRVGGVFGAGAEAAVVPFQNGSQP